MKKLYTILLLIITGFFLSFTNDNKTHNSENTTAKIAVRNDKEIMNAALVAPDGYSYFFKGIYYHKYDINKDKLVWIRKINKTEWKGLATNVDAALMHPTNGKAYIFRGNMYYRYDFKATKVDKKGIVGVDGWKGLNGPFDAVVARPKSGFSYFFKGNKVYRYSHYKHKMDKVSTVGQAGWKGVPNKPDLVLAHTNGKVYFFKDDVYYRYNWVTQKVDKVGLIGKNGWKGLFKRIDASLSLKYVFRGKYIYGDKTVINATGKFRFPGALFKPSPKAPGYANADADEVGGGSLTTNKEYSKKRLGYDNFYGIPQNIDAVLANPTNKKLYFFKGSKYYRYNPSTKKVDNTGTIGQNGWKGVSGSINAAFVHDNGKAYFFYGNFYYRFDFKTNKVDKRAGVIKNNWKGVPNFVDAVRNGADHKVYFYKKSTEYVYDSSKKKVIEWNKIPSAVLK